MMKRALLIAIVALAGLATGPTAAFAETINFLGTGKGMTVDVTSPTLGPLTVHAGELQMAICPAGAGRFRGGIFRILRRHQPTPFTHRRP